MPGLPVAQHFAQGHDINSHITISGVFHCSGDDQSRKEMENKLIFKLGCLQPKGLNASFSSFKL
jgi:hypothetical protein